VKARDAELLAWELMAEHGLEDWTFEFDNAKRRFGVCKHSKQVIGLSKALVEINDYERVRQTILHEIAHALAGYYAGHGPEWRKMCHKVGIEPRRGFSQEDTNIPDAKWTASCPKCSKVFKRHRLSKSLKENGGWCPCVNGYPVELRLRWVDNSKQSLLAAV
jgi:predicted SprT family Zn-dependent metalloprotease